MKRKLLLTLGFASILVLASCGEKSEGPKPNNNNKSEPEIEEVPVFVLSGQSNMEGSTLWRLNDKNLLKEYMDEAGEDYSVIEKGIDSVLTSYYGYYYPIGWKQAHSSSTDKSTPQDRLTPNFLPTTVGMGVADTKPNQGIVADSFFGPELGMAYKLNQVYEGNEPIHLVKCAFSASGFEKTDGANWKNREDSSLTEEQNANNSLYYLLKRYTNNCIKLIEDEGKKPIIKGFVWHQGESDCGTSDYDVQMEKLISDFRTDFAEFADDEDGKNIAFLDCTIYDGPNNPYGGGDGVNAGINAKKKNIAAKGQLDSSDENYEKNFLVDATFTETGMKLEIGDLSKGGYNTYHYNTKDAFFLGEAYADIILKNNLLD